FISLSRFFLVFIYLLPLFPMILYVMEMIRLTMMSTLKPLHLPEREDLEALGSLVKVRFSTAKPKNFWNDFLLTTLEAMFERPDAHAQI
nr:hypothetical protein [Tanacetum cinerariifolium]